MSRIYLFKRGLFRQNRFVDRSDLMDTITELQLENSLLRDELEACQELLSSKAEFIQSLQNQIRKQTIKIDHLKLELAVVNKSLDIMTDPKADD